MVSTGRLGFSLVEMIITVAIIGTLAGASLLSHSGFTSQSGLHLRASDVLEFVRYAQDRSSSSETLSAGSDLPTQGFQVVRLRVRNGRFSSLRLERVPGAFAGFSVDEVNSENNFDAARQGSVPGSLVSTAQPQEEFFVDLCFIDVDATQRYARRRIGVTGSGSDDSDCSTAILCASPDPSARGFSASDTEKNDFDVVFAVEQPAREVSMNAVAVDGLGRYKYAYTEPNGPDALVSDTYEGVRVVFITSDGDKKSVDVYKTGLVSVSADDGDDGCGS